VGRENNTIELEQLPKALSHASRSIPMTDMATKTTVWTIDPAHSVVEFSVKHMMFATVKGRFTDVIGQIRVDEEDVEDSSVDVEIGAASVDTGNERRDADLRSANFFEVDSFPTIRFTSTRVIREGDALVITGDLFMHGVTRPVTLDGMFNGQGTNPTGQQVASYSATTRLNRKDFGLNWNAALETGGVLVGEEVRIDLEIEAFA
jgi:polyisoprenoid-binding protein YceI